ncbi:hypothetical protein ACFL4T_09510 [candidate division KSB1 bacterium]
MRIFNVLLFLSFIFILNCSKKSADPGSNINTPQTVNYELTRLWITGAIFDHPEAVYYDKFSDFIYVSNMGGEDPYQVDNNGYISKLSLDGEIVDLNWINGMNCPLGMVSYNGNLYVVDINRLIEINLENKNITNIFTEDEALLFNDIAVDTVSGTLYLSDFGGYKLYSFKDGEFERRYQFGESIVPNGLCIIGNYLYIGNAYTIIQFDIDTDETSVIFGGSGIVDGLEHFDNNILIGSDYAGHVYLFTPPSLKKEILDLTGENFQAANIDYVKDKRLLLIPSILRNRVIAYEINY